MKTKPKAFAPKGRGKATKPMHPPKHGKFQKTGGKDGAMPMVTSPFG